VPAAEAIHHNENGTPVPYTNAFNQVLSIIDQNSPNGPDGRFSTAGHVGSYESLPG
jgi:hypothetical protein